MKYNRIIIILFNIATTLLMLFVVAPYAQNELDIHKDYGLLFIGVMFTGIISYFLIQLYRKRKCKHCNAADMKRKFDNDENEYIFVCPNCKSEKRSGLFFGGSD
jgi:uncharacterized protein (UPF0333 family)